MRIETENLTKEYGKNRVLDSFNYEFTPGIYGLLGPNGVGKTTLMNLLTDNLMPTSGDICYDGQSIRALGARYRRKIGFMPQQQNIYPAFTVERFLWYMAGLKGLSKQETKEDIERLLALVNLSEHRTKRLGEFSGGMKQRALLAQALLGKPEIIILDEPTAGLDPKERIRMRNLISQVGFECIILIATHVVQDIQFIAKEVLIMGRQKILDSGSPSELCTKINGVVYELETDDKGFAAVNEAYRVVNVCRDGEVIRVRVLAEEKPEQYPYQLVKPDLEDLYLYYFE